MLHSVIKNAYKAALRDGYNQVVIRSNDGEYSFSRKYPGCCPDWYGNIVSEINVY